MRHQLPRSSIGGGDGGPSTPIMPTRASGSHFPRRRTDPHGPHHHHQHFTNASAAAALSPLLKSKYKSNAGAGRVSFGPGTNAAGTHATLLGHDEKKKEDAEREEKMAQLQQPDPGLEAAEHTPTVLRMMAQYNAGGGPRQIPSSLRTGLEGVAFAATVDAFYTAPFLQLSCREATEREVAARLRGYVKKMTSKLHAVRVEGLKEAMAQLLQWTTQASVESAERRQEQQWQQTDAAVPQPLSGGYAGTSSPSSMPSGVLMLPPYDAVGVEVLGASSSSPISGGHNGHRRSTSPSSKAGEGGGGGRAKADYIFLARAANAARSPSWDVVQQALEGVDYTSAIFNTILVPRLEVRNAMSTGMPISIQLTSETALQWTTLPATRKPAPTAAAAAVVAHEELAARQAAPTKCNELLQEATAVTFEEQELALRYIQGACLTLYYQRRCCSEGCLIYYATEVFQCMRSHAEALFTWQRRELEEQQQQQNASGNRRGSDEEGAPRPSATGPAAMDPLLTNTTSTMAAAAALREVTGRSEVSIDPSLVRVVIAAVEAVEAACHYNPSCLRRLVQTGGVTAMLNLAYCPFMPMPVRAAVLGTISVLLQEVNPLRRYVAAASKPGEGSSVDCNADPLLQRMVENAMHDNPIGLNGKQIPYSTDRGSASKFDSAVRDWFFANGLGNVIPSVIHLQDLRSTFQSTSFMIPQSMASATAGGAAAGQGSGGMGARGGGGLPAGVGGMAAVANTGNNNLSFASLMASAGPSLHGPLTGRTYGGAVTGAVAGGANTSSGGGGAVGAAAAATTHANMQRESELYRKRVGRLLECMDGRELR